MIDFLNLKENNNNSCECVFKAHSLQLLPNKYEPYVFYIGEWQDYPFLLSVDILNIYGDVINLINTDLEHDNFISLSNIPYDDYNNVVLKVVLKSEDNENKVLYSDELKISSYNACKTTRINFKCKETDSMQSIQVPIWFKYEGRALELSQYYQISTKSSISFSTSNAKFKVYQTELISNHVLTRLNDALQLPYVYFDYKRVTLYESFEVEEPQGDSNFSETQIIVSMYEGIGINDITPTFYLTTEDGNHIITENNNNIITE